MKILWVKAGGLVPPDVGGKIRSYYMLRELAKQHKITFFTFYAAHSGDMHGELDRVFDRSLCIPLQIPVPRSRGELAHFARHVLSLLPYSAAKHTPPQVLRSMRELIASESFDVIVCDFVVAGAVVPWDIPCPKILFTHNVEALIWKRHMGIARNPFWKAVCWREYKLMERLENRCVKAANHVLTVSQFDREIFSSIVPKEKITIIPTGVDTDYFEPATGAEKPNSLVFTGAMDWLPNQDAIVYFVQEILPLIAAEVPDVTLSVVGRNPSQRVQELSKNQNIRVTGRVDDVRPFVAKAAVYVVPLRVGSGTRLKIFEAMAMGKPVVSTTVGAEGLPVCDGEHLLLGDTPAIFAERTVALLRNRSRREQLGMNARQLVEQSYSWASAAKVFESVLEAVGTRSEHAGRRA